MQTNADWLASTLSLPFYPFSILASTFSFDIPFFLCDQFFLSSTRELPQYDDPVYCNMFSRFFSRKKQPASSKLILYLNPDFKQEIEVEDQVVGQYLESTEEAKEYIFLLVKDKNKETVLKRKLNLHQRFSDALKELDPEHKGYLVMGYDNIHKNNTRMNMLKNGIDNEATQSIRSGTLYKYDDTTQKFEQCQFKLLPNYLIYYKLKKKDDISFIPLENASIVHMDEGQLIFGIHEKFKTIKVKAMSKEDMKGWLISIDDAIKIKQCEKGLAKCAERVATQQSHKIKRYEQQSKNLVEHDKILVTDPKGRKALQSYFHKQPEQVPENDVKLFSIYCKYVYYCELLREESPEAKEVVSAIEQDIRGLSKYIEEALKLESPLKERMENNELYKTLDLIATYLGKRYHQKLKVGRYLHHAILQAAVNQHKEQNKLHLVSILGTVEKKV